MRAGRLKTRTYKTRRGGAGRALLLILLAAFLALGARLWRGGTALSLPFSAPRAAASPTLRESPRESRQITLPGKTWYALQMAASDAETAARQQADSLRSRGAAGYLYREELYRVLGAAYETRSDAQKVQNQLRLLHGIEVRVVDISRPEITLRLTGQADQLTALEDAYGLVDQAAEQLSALSQALDGRTMTGQAILPALTSQRDTAEALSSRLAELFGGEMPAAVQEMKTLLDDLALEIGTALSARTDTALGAQIKYCQLLCVCRMAACARALAGASALTAAGCTWGRAGAC